MGVRSGSLGDKNQSNNWWDGERIFGVFVEWGPRKLNREARRGRRLAIVDEDRLVPWQQRGDTRSLDCARDDIFHCPWATVIRLDSREVVSTGVLRGNSREGLSRRPIEFRRGLEECGGTV